jgi:hypothetical protein
MTRGRWQVQAAGAVLAVLAAGGLGWLVGHQQSGVFESGVQPVAVGYDFPSYAVVRDHRMVIGHGGREVTLRNAIGALWLPNGTVLASLKHGPRYYSYQAIDATGGTTGPVLSADDEPSRAGRRLNLWFGKSDPDGDKPHDLVRSYAGSDLHLVDTITMPGPKTRGPDPRDNPFERFYKEYAATIDGNTFAIYTDGNDTDNGDQNGDDGVVMVHHGKARDVLVNQRITSLRLSADGAGLIAVQQKHGHPCGGCVVDQQIVEIDPATGGIAKTYGVPAGYDKSWRIVRIDKVGDRVAVRYAVTCVDPGCGDRVVGTYVYDGSWSKLKGSADVESWWQGPHQRIELRGSTVRDGQVTGGTLYAVDSVAGTSTAIEGVLDPRTGELDGSVPGTLVPPV